MTGSALSALLIWIERTDLSSLETIGAKHCDTGTQAYGAFKCSCTALLSRYLLHVPANSCKLTPSNQRFRPSLTPCRSCTCNRSPSYPRKYIHPSDWAEHKLDIVSLAGSRPFTCRLSYISIRGISLRAFWCAAFRHLLGLFAAVVGLNACETQSYGLFVTYISKNMPRALLNGFVQSTSKCLVSYPSHKAVKIGHRAFILLHIKIMAV